MDKQKDKFYSYVKIAVKCKLNRCNKNSWLRIV